MLMQYADPQRKITDSQNFSPDEIVKKILVSEELSMLSSFFPILHGLLLRHMVNGHICPASFQTPGCPHHDPWEPASRPLGARITTPGRPHHDPWALAYHARAPDTSNKKISPKPENFLPKLKNFLPNWKIFS